MKNEEKTPVRIGQTHGGLSLDTTAYHVQLEKLRETIRRFLKKAKPGQVRIRTKRKRPRGRRPTENHVRYL